MRCSLPGPLLRAVAWSCLLVLSGLACPVPAAAQPELAPEPVELAVLVTSPDGPRVDTTIVRTADPEAAAARLEARPEIVVAEVNGRARVTAPDPYRPRQWALDRLQAENTWQAVAPRFGAAGQVVAVVDTGVDAAHPDLADVVVPGVDLVADGTGSGDGRNDPQGHGTHVAGVIAATANNGQGTAGLAPGVRILPIRALGADGTGWYDDIANGIIEAADRGASVINLSLGTEEPPEVIRGAIGHALDRGAVVVAAGGNEYEDGNPASYPAAYPETIAVTATARDDSRARFANTGSYVDLAAPGEGIVSTWPSATYQSLSGTSMATPHVSAVAALLRAYACGLGSTDVADVLAGSAEDLGEAGRDEVYGDGVVQPVDALDDLQAQPERSEFAEQRPAVEGVLGSAVGAPVALRGGCSQNHRRGRSFWSQATRTHEVHGDLLRTYSTLGGSNRFGFPTTNEIPVRGGRASYFERGRAYWSTATGARLVYGSILTAYLARQGPDGVLRLPTSDELSVRGGRASYFQGGRVYWSARTSARAVYGAILSRYLRLGGPDSRLGLPTSDEHDIEGGRRTRFTGGWIDYDWSTRTTRVTYT